MADRASTCGSCGVEVSAVANWCQACGADLRSSVLVLDGESEVSSIEVVAEPRPVRWWVVGGVLLAVAVLIGIASLTGGSDEPAPGEDAEGLEADEEPAAAADESGPPDESVDVEQEPPVDVDEVPAEPGDETDGAGGDPTLTGPLLGGETGLDLLLTTDRGSFRLNLDTGVVDEIEIQAGQFHSGWGRPVGVLAIDGGLVSMLVGPDLVLEVRPVDDLTAAPAAIELPARGVGGGLQVAPSSVSGRVWILADDHRDDRLPRYALQEVDLATGETVTSRVVEALPFFPPVLGPEGAVVWSPNGTKLVGRDGVEDWPYGQAFVFGPGVVLTLVCDDDLDCRTGFVDLESGELTELEGPPLPWYGPGPGSFDAAGELYAVFDWEIGSIRVIDVRSGELVHAVSLGQPNDEVFPVLSPDGRFVAWVQSGTVRLSQLGRDEVVVVDQDQIGTRVHSWSTGLIFLPAG